MSDFPFNPDTTKTAERSALTETTLRGEILRIVFAAEDGHYTVVRLLDDKGLEHTLVGALSGVVEGQDIEASGIFETHKEHGRQLRVKRFRALLPTSARGIERYLGSGLIHGIGPKLAARIVARFGLESLKILDKYSSRLKEVPGLGKKKIELIRQAWQTQSQQRDTFIFLQGLGISPALCARLFTRYGMGAGEAVKQNPYQLAAEVRGIGFLTADRIARELGIAADAPLRLSAGIVYVLDKLSEEGHVCFPEKDLLIRAGEILQVPAEKVADGLTRALTNGTAIRDAESHTAEPVIYHRRLFAAEMELARCVNTLSQYPPDPGGVKPALEGSGFGRLDQRQREAVAAAFDSRLSIITGGPGVGKTTVVGEIVTAARKMGLSVYLAAPTGRAAKRLSESCRQEARTIHRLLKWDPQTQSFVYHRDRPLNCRMLVIDEVSMLDVELSRHLFEAISPDTHVVLVGDRDQLPSVGPGSVFNDLISSGRIPVTHLTAIYRQAAGSRIVTNAHRVNAGRMPDLRSPPASFKGDFYWIDEEDPERVVQLIAEMTASRIPRRFRFNPMEDIQVLTPMNKGVCGAIALNQRLQHMLNAGPKAQIRLGDHVLKTGDRVMQVINNYDKGVFNGELGRVGRVDNKKKTFAVMFDTATVDYDFGESDQLKLAYAVTVHKSQGCEFPVVIMPVLSQHFIMLQRNLIYTGMTRAKKLLIMVGTRKALSIALRNNQPAQRHTRLTARLRPAAY
ncbi:MAG: ATP-dependent RecD-like DNA helicase [Lentisphaeria bacterium]|nr:ATP-dependent RecD-like DNA helicase [Lentisphaeria bacterium]